MPELPEVETIKEAMRKTFVGAEVKEAFVYQRHFRIDTPQNFEKIIIGSKILKIYRIAKYALAQLDNGYTIVWHFGMSGKIKITDTVLTPKEKHDHIVIITSNGVLTYNDPRRFGIVTLVRSSDVKNSPIFCHLGLDPFDEQFNANYLREKFKFKSTPIKLSLLDQSVVCGIGNIYASESLYEARISPLRVSSSLNKKELQCLVTAIQTTLKKAIAAGGSTLHDYRKPDGDIGYFQNQHCVYGKEGKPCLNCTCKKGIQKIVQNGRSTYYCEHLQK